MGLLKQLQLWIKVPGTVMQYSDFSVILGSLIKQCILFEFFFAVFPPPYAKFWIHASNTVYGVRGRGGPV